MVTPTSSLDSKYSPVSLQDNVDPFPLNSPNLRLHLLPDTRAASPPLASRRHPPSAHLRGSDENSLVLLHQGAGLNNSKINYKSPFFLSPPLPEGRRPLPRKLELELALKFGPGPPGPGEPCPWADTKGARARAARAVAPIKCVLTRHAPHQKEESRPSSHCRGPGPLGPGEPCPWAYFLMGDPGQGLVILPLPVLRRLEQKFSLLLLRAVSNHRSSSPHCDEDTPPHAAERVLHLRSVLPPPVPKKREREGEGEGRPGRAEGFILMKICAPNSGPDPQGPGEPCPWADEEGSGPRWLRARHTRCKMRPVDGRPERHYI